MSQFEQSRVDEGMNEAYKWSPVMNSFLAGSFSGSCSTILFQPLELIKTRLQMCNHESPSRNLPASMIRIAVEVVRNESVFALWRGLCPSLYRTVPGIGVYFCTLHSLTHKFGTGSPLPAAQSFMFGAASRSLAALATMPFSVVKTRFESGSFQYHGVVDALSRIYQNEGIRGLSRGLLATLLRDVPFSAFYLMFYNHLKEIVSKEERIPNRNHPGINFFCGTVAGCLASIATHPPDVIKTRLQLYPDQFPKSRHAFVHILKNDGLKGFFHGLLPRLVRRTLMAAMSWTIYEETMKYLELRH